MINNRNIALDIAKGIGILLVIVGHTAGLKHICQEMIYCFHMPLFFIIAGYLYHRQDIKSLFAKSAKRLLLPWIITLLLIIVSCLLMGDRSEALGFMQGILFPDGSRSDNLLWPGIHSSGAIWFLPALFWCRIVYALIEQRTNQKSIYITIPLTIISVLLGRFVLNLPLAIQIGCSALVFYEFGHRMRTYKLFEKKIPLWAMLFFIPLWMFYERYVTFEMFGYNYGWTYPFDVAIALLVTYALIVGCAYIVNVKWLSYGCAWLGRNTLYILCTHTLMLLVLGKLNVILQWNGWCVMLINISLSFILAMVYAKIKEKAICHH